MSELCQTCCMSTYRFRYQQKNVVFLRLFKRIFSMMFYQFSATSLLPISRLVFFALGSATIHQRQSMVETSDSLILGQIEVTGFNCHEDLQCKIYTSWGIIHIYRKIDLGRILSRMRFKRIHAAPCVS